MKRIPAALMTWVVLAGTLLFAERSRAEEADDSAIQENLELLLHLELIEDWEVVEKLDEKGDSDEKGQ